MVRLKGEAKRLMFGLWCLEIGQEKYNVPNKRRRYIIGGREKWSKSKRIESRGGFFAALNCLGPSKVTRIWGLLPYSFNIFSIGWRCFTGVSPLNPFKEY